MPEYTVNVLPWKRTHPKVLEATCDSPYVEVRVRPVQRDAGPASFQVAARLRPDCPVGTWNSTVWLLTDNPVLHRLQIPLTVEVAFLRLGGDGEGSCQTAGQCQQGLLHGSVGVCDG